jgi:hypothetical protein
MARGGNRHRITRSHNQTLAAVSPANSQ